MMKRLRLAIILGCFWPSVSLGHGPRPEVIGLTVSAMPGGGIHALTDNQGVFAALNFSYKWVCEDAIYPLARTQGLALFGADERRWLVATNHGLHISVDGGCDFQAVDHPLGTERLSGLWKNVSTDAVYTATASLDAPSRLYQSVDQGRTWTQLNLAADGVVENIQWIPTEPQRMLVQAAGALYINGIDGQTFESFVVRINEQVIPTEFIRHMVTSPVNPDRMLAVVNAGERTRILLTTDLGQTWQDVALLDAADVSALFHRTGEQVMVVGRLGGRWKSMDAGATFEREPLGPPTVRCLTRGADDWVYACANPNADGPFVIGRTRDFGQSWTAVLARFEDTDHRKDCATNDRTVQCCRGRCPGDETMCGQPLNPEWPPECYETMSSLSDQGLADAGIGMSIDAGLSLDRSIARPDSADALATSILDSTVANGAAPMLSMSEEKQTGCQSTLHRSSTVAGLWFYLVLLGFTRLYMCSRRRSFGQAT